jgi:general secretion pathway protein K
MPGPHPLLHARSANTNRRARGFGLIAVVWVTALLSLLALSFANSVRTHVRIAANAASSAAAEALADGGVQLAMLEINRLHEAAERSAPAGTFQSCQMPGGGIVAFALADEAGKLDLNVARAPLLTAFFIGNGFAPDRARGLADAIIDYRDSDDDRRASGAERDDYTGAGLSAGPKNAAFDTVDELVSVLGFQRSDLERLRPFLTVHSGQEGIDPSSAAPELIAALANGKTGDIRLPTAGAAGGLSGSGLPPEFTVASVRRTFGVRAIGKAAGGSVFVREAVVAMVAAPRTLNRPVETTTDSGMRARPPGSGRQAMRLTPRILNWRQGATPPQAIGLPAIFSPC